MTCTPRTESDSSNDPVRQGTEAKKVSKKIDKELGVGLAYALLRGLTLRPRKRQLGLDEEKLKRPKVGTGA